MYYLAPLIPFLYSLIFAPVRNPVVKLDSASFVGATVGNAETFLGIPYAQPPTGNNRFRLPKPIERYTSGIHNASDYGANCPQQTMRIPNHEAIPPLIIYALNAALAQGPQSEDCLTINVVRPAGIPATARLPVAVWFFGGGFQFGSTRGDDGKAIVERSIALGQPIVYVSMNYRLSGLGFMPGKEVKDAKVGNLGLHDQREALRWVQRYIHNFGGDASKTTIWGLSAGGMSASLHMLANDGDTEGLFRGAYMQSGAPIAVDDLERGQKYYDAVVDETGCTGAADTLDCLRKVPFETLKVAIDRNPSILDYEMFAVAYGPRVDGVFIKDHPSKLVKSGKVADIPIVHGTVDDEGTMFAVATANITTSAQLKEYLQTVYFPNASSKQISRLLKAYPEDLAAGSPFGTGSENAMTPQFKRIAAIIGDIQFQAPKRMFMRERSEKQPSWAYLHKRSKGFPHIGAHHCGDNHYAGTDLTDYLVRFVNTLDPNGNASEGFHWPKYTPSEPKLLTLHDTEPPLSINKDDAREQEIAFLNELLLEHPL